MNALTGSQCEYVYARLHNQHVMCQIQGWYGSTLGAKGKLTEQKHTETELKLAVCIEYSINRKYLKSVKIKKTMKQKYKKGGGGGGVKTSKIPMAKYKKKVSLVIVSLCSQCTFNFQTSISQLRFFIQGCQFNYHNKPKGQ